VICQPLREEPAFTRLRRLVFATAVLVALARVGTGGATEPIPGIAASERVGPGLDIREYRVEGSRVLPALAVEAAVSPFLGPGRTLGDIEAARAALEKAYQDAGYQSVTVAVPRQTVREGVVVLTVTEAKVDRLRVRGARWFLPSDVRRLAPSMAEGTVPEFNAIGRDIVALNQLADRRVTPALRAGAVPGTIDVDLNVEDTLPLHGALELNNRHGQSSYPLRVLGSLRYANLWQAGHTLGVSFQVAPQSKNGNPGGLASFRTADPDARVVMATYAARFEDPSWLGLSTTATYQDGKVQTRGGTVVESRGQSVGVRAIFALPGSSKALHNVTMGVDYKRFGQDIRFGSDKLAMPITYWPASVQYGLVYAEDSSQTLLDAGATMNVRPLSSSPVHFDDRRYDASDSFFYLRGDLSRTDELRPLQTAMRLQGQLAWEPLIPSEQFAAGGVDTVRGYLESTAVGDSGAALSLELRSGSVSAGRWLKEGRFLVFADGAWAGIRDALPEQKRTFWLASAGAGLRLRLAFVSAELDLGVPLVTEGVARRFHPAAHFRVASEF